MDELKEKFYKAYGGFFCSTYKFTKIFFLSLLGLTLIMIVFAILLPNNGDKVLFIVLSIAFGLLSIGALTLIPTSNAIVKTYKNGEYEIFEEKISVVIDSQKVELADGTIARYSGSHSPFVGLVVWKVKTDKTNFCYERITK